MKKVEGIIRLIRENGQFDLLIKNKQGVLQLLIMNFGGNTEEFVFKDLEFVIRPMQVYKSNNQMAYINCEIKPKSGIGFRGKGYPYTDTEALLKLQEMYLTEERVNEHSGQPFVVTKDFKDATMSEVARFIDLSIQYIQENLETPVQTPEEHKEEMRKLEEFMKEKGIERKTLKKRQDK